MSDDPVDIFGNRNGGPNGNGFGLPSPNGMPSALSRAYHEASRPLASHLSHELDRDELRSYLLDASDPRQGKFQCQIFSLVHITDHDRDTVTSLIIPARCESEEERALLVEKAVVRLASCAANTEAEPVGQKQRFRVTGTVGTNPATASWSAYAFHVTPPPEARPQSGLDRFDREQLSTESVVGAQERIINVLAKQSAQDKDRLVALLVASQEREERIAEARERLWMEREQLRDESADREIRGHREKLEAEAMSDLWKGLRTYGFQWVSQALAKSNPLDGFSKTIQPTQIMMMLEMMDETQREAFSPVLPMLVSGLSPAKKGELGRLVAARNAAKAAEAAAAQAPRVTVMPAAAEPAPAPEAEAPAAVYEVADPSLRVEAAPPPDLPPLEAPPSVPPAPPPAPTRSSRPSARVRAKRKK